jgi:hypothetical protein
MSHLPSSARRPPESIDQVQPGIYYSINQLRHLLGVSYNTLKTDVDDGLLPAICRRGGRRILGADFLAYLEAGKVRPKEHRKQKPSPQQSQGQPFKALDANRLRQAWSGEE